jgi:hypothetical protein
MKRASWASALPATVLGAVLATGCGSQTANDEVVGTRATPPPQAEGPVYKGYADYAKAQHEQTSQAAGKGASKGQGSGKGKEAPAPK